MGCSAWREIVDHRLRWRAATSTLLISAICSCHVIALHPHLASPACKAVAVLAPAPLISLVMASMSPAASLDDISPELERGMLFGSSVGAAASFVNWFTALRSPHAMACHYLTLLPGFLMSLACLAVPFCGMRNPLYYWPAWRFAMITSALSQFVRTVTQANALGLANAAAALGLSELLPVSRAAQCQAYPTFLPGGISEPTALAFGCLTLLTGLLLTPSVRLRLAILAGRFGSPAARVLHLGDGILLEPDELKPSTALPVFKAPRRHHQGGHQFHPPPHHGHSKSVIFSDGDGGAVESLHETASSMTEGELELYLHGGARWRSEDKMVDPFLRHRDSPSDGDNVESLHETMSSKSAHSELERVLRHGHDGANGHVSLQAHEGSFGSHLRRQKSSASARRPPSEPVSLPPAPPSSASLSVLSEEMTARDLEACAGPNAEASRVSVEMVEQELAAIVDDDVIDIEAIERAGTPPPPPPPPPPPTCEAASVVGQLDAFAEVAKSWQGALFQLLKESRAPGRDRRRDAPVARRDSATRPDQSEKKRPRSETGAAVAERAPLRHNSSSSEDLTAPLSDDSNDSNALLLFHEWQPHPNPPFGGKPHPNPRLAKPHPTHLVPGLTIATSSPGKPPPACAPGSGLYPPITAANHFGACGIEESQTRSVVPHPAPDLAPSVGKEAATAPTEASKPLSFKPKKPQRSCAKCGTTETPKWRAGGTLCNACGLKHPMETPPHPNAFG